MDEYAIRDLENDQNDSDNNLDCVNGDVFNYKGYFAQDNENEVEEDEPKTFEFGAHFPYRFLYRKLELLANELNERRLMLPFDDNRDDHIKDHILKDKALEYIAHKEASDVKREDETNNISMPQKNLSCIQASALMMKENKPSNGPQMFSSYVTKLKIKRKFEPNVIKKDELKHYSQCLGKNSSSSQNKVIKRSVNTRKLLHTKDEKGNMSSSGNAPQLKYNTVQSLNNLHKPHKAKHNCPFSPEHPEMCKFASRNKSDQRKQLNQLIKASIAKDRSINDLTSLSKTGKYPHQVSNDSLLFPKHNKSDINNLDKQHLPSKQPLTATVAKEHNRISRNTQDLLASIGLSSQHKSRNAQAKNRTQSNHLSNQVTDRDSSSHPLFNKTYVHSKQKQKDKQEMTKTISSIVNSRNYRTKIDNSNYFKFKTYLDLKLNMIQQTNKEIIDNVKKNIRLYSLEKGEKDGNKEKQAERKGSKPKSGQHNHKVITINNSTNTNSRYSLQQKELRNYNAKTSAAQSVVIKKKIEFNGKEAVMSHSILSKVPFTISEKKKDEITEKKVSVKPGVGIANGKYLQFNKLSIQPKSSSSKKHYTNLLFNDQYKTSK